MTVSLILLFILLFTACGSPRLTLDSSERQPANQDEIQKLQQQIEELQKEKMFLQTYQPLFSILKPCGIGPRRLSNA